MDSLKINRPSDFSQSATGQDPLFTEYIQVRQQTERICAPLEIEDYGIQAAAFASPPKWHLAHTAWFFETFLLIPYVPGYRRYHPRFESLFNSYYDTIGDYHPRHERGHLSRPTVNEVYRYRAHIDEHMERLLTVSSHPMQDDIRFRTRLGIHHEQQHQELLLTDIKYNFFSNPLRPAYTNVVGTSRQVSQSTPPLRWLSFDGGVKSIGFDGEGFCYDNETPRHKCYLNDFRLASRPVTNAEFITFVDDGGYRNPDLWLSDAWKIINQQSWSAPLYWSQEDGQWRSMTLAGMQPVDMHAPVSHISFFEALAYARWAGKRLPSEAEWDIAAETVSVTGNFVENACLQPVASEQGTPLQQMFGDVWEWTHSPYTPYPGYKQAHGPLGEYNGKFMSAQMVLRGGSCATPQSHIRSTYRNFFYPHERWQFSGFRLAEDL